MRPIFDVLNINRRSQKISVTVVINTDNRGVTIEKTLEGLRRQTYQKFEVVVVTGPSAESTNVLLRRYAPHIKIARCPEAKIGISRNIGVEVATGDVVAFIDDDAVPESSWLERIVSGYQDPSVAAVGGHVFDVPLGRIEWRICTCTRSGEPSTDAPPPAEIHLGKGANPFLYLAGCNMSFRRSVLIATGGFNELFAYGYDDVEVCCRIVDSGQKIALLEDAIVNHDRAPNSIRDSGQVIKDVYPMLFARIVFALQSRSAATSIQSLVSVFEDNARHWRTFARHRLDEGTFTAAEYVRFVRRIDEAVTEGIAAAALPRFFRIFVAQRKAAFHQYPTLPKSRSHAGRSAKSG
jgi:glycosyltransferase involved in cell wall biosynthesis